MKLKRVAQLCNQRGIYVLYDRVGARGGDEQWLGDDVAQYPIIGMPYMEEENIYAMFDIPEKKQKKILFLHDTAPSGMCFEDVDRLEQEIKWPRLRVRYKRQTLIPLRTSQGIVFIEEKYLAPIDDMDYVTFHERKDAHADIYIAVKVGMMIQAVIKTADIDMQDFIDHLEELATQCKYSMNRSRRSEPPDDGQGSMFQVDQETGEVIDFPGGKEGAQADG